MGEKGTNNLVRELADHRASEFIEDGKKEFITCSACREQLVEIWMLRPEAPIITEMVVDCPFCGDKSFKKTIPGQYCLGHLESGKVAITETPTDVETTEDNKLLQKVHIKTARRDT